MAGSYKVTDVTMKRGVIGELAILHAWLVNVRDGADDRRTITINLMGEDRITVAQTWTLSNAKPMKYTGPSLTGKGTDVAIEEVAFAYEHMDIS
jgi:phage tail-like protein